MKNRTMITAALATLALGMASVGFGAAQSGGTPGVYAQSSGAANGHRIARQARRAMFKSLNNDERTAVKQILMIERALRQSDRGSEVIGFYQDTLKRTSSSALRGLIEMRLVRLEGRAKGNPVTLPMLEQNLSETLSRLR